MRLLSIVGSGARRAFIAEPQKTDRYFLSPLSVSSVTLWSVFLVGLSAYHWPAEESPVVRQAISKGLENVRQAAEKYPKHRSCFSCHHQTLPLLTLVTARARGFVIDEKLLQSQGDFSRDSFASSLPNMAQGKGVGGRAMTVAYALWALSLLDRKPDKTTEAMVSYLLKTQRSEGHWTGQVSRPPLEESYQTCTVLSALGLRRFATDVQRAVADSAVAKAREWLVTAPAKGQEDKAFRLWGLNLLGGKPEDVRAAREALLKAQRPDGGWAQLDEMNSDAYATGQTLFILQSTGGGVADAVYKRGVRFLLKTQRPDGAWLVSSRSRPIQPYHAFDDEDPLGKDQFISVPATCWAVAALVAAEPSASAKPHPSDKETLVKKAKAALKKGNADEALDLAGQAIAADPKDDQGYLFRGSVYETLERHAEAIQDFDKAIELNPKAAEAYDHCGSEHFKLGHIQKSIEDFDKFIALRPEAKPGHWKRGISCYYAGRFDDGRKQFEAYQAVDSNDVENAVWRFLCMARATGIDKARADMMKVGHDSRVPMMTIYELFRGQAKPEDILDAARQGQPKEAELQQRLFYAHLYLGLYFDVQGDKKKALEHLSAADKLPTGGYMHDVARVHRTLLEKKQ
jgi:tetratricopeptide (TPR) repeat protein